MISVVVPVYNVEPYVRECLVSLRSQTYDAWEAIIIDDCSTDGSMRVVLDIVATDDRFRVVRLPANGGLGNARNVGIAESNGDYVMFLDSDDYLEPFALERIAESITEASEPDIVWFDYTRERWWGRRTRNIYGHILGEVGSGPTTIAQHTELLQILPIAPNKAYRLAYLRTLDFPFAPGLYEDIPFTYPVLLNAASISIVDEPLYVYRQRRLGSLRQAMSTMHFDVLDQYELMFSRVDYENLHDGIRSILYKKLIDHFGTIYELKTARIPPESRARFFHATSRVAARYETEPDRRPIIGMRRLQLLVGDKRLRYRLTEVPETIRTTIRGRFRFRGDRRRVRLSKRRTRIKRWLYRMVMVRQPLDTNLAIFYIHNGPPLHDNPGAIHRELLRTRPNVRAIWAVSPKVASTVERDLPAVEIGSWEYYKAIARASYFVADESFPNHFIKRDGAVFVQTLHGTPFETIYTDTRPYVAVSKGVRFGPMLQRSDAWDYCVSSSPYSTEIISRAIPSKFDVLEFGQPRNDVFFGDVESVCREMRSTLGIHQEALVILYAPARRVWERTTQSRFDINEFVSRFSSDVVLLTTAQNSHEEIDHTAGNHDRVIRVSQLGDLNRIAAAADLLITDYSSIMFDFALLNRPIVIYAEDYDAFSAVRGVYFDLRESPPGAVVTSQTELFRLIESEGYDTEATRGLLAAFRSRFCEFEDGHAARRVVARVFE